jgi:glycosyltransferase involved in cell wall biosynthesis
MQNAHTIALIIPALNEEVALQKLLADLPAQVVDHVIVVDNGSTDSTPHVAREAGAHVVSESIRGYGRACFSGSLAAKTLHADILVFMDGDGSDNPSDLELMLQPVLDDQADFVIGSRVSPLAERGAVPPQARLGNWLVSRVIGLRYGLPLHDVGSFRVIRSSVLDLLQMREMTFGWPVEMLAKTAQSGYRIVEIPLHYRRRQHGRSKVAGTLSGSIRAAYLMLRTTVRYVGRRRTYA